jgi:tetratricopeptide (TPR) repeat protein
MKTLQQSLHEASEACRKGARVPPIRTQDEKVLNDELRGAIKANLPVFDRVWIDKCEKAYSRGFEAALAGKSDIARKAFEIAESVLQTNPLFYESRLLSTSFLQAAAAYLDYSLKDFDAARAKLLEAIQCDDVLEAQFGYSTLHIHRVHLLENIMRLEFQADHPREALSLARSLLLYLAGAAPEVSAPGNWGQDRLARVPAEAVSSKFAGIAADVAQFLAPLDVSAAREFFCLVFPSFHSGKQEYCHPQAMQWFAIKKAFYSAQHPDFLSKASEFLVKGPQASPGLWSAVVLDVIALCDTLLPQAEVVRRQIVSDAMSWEFMPRRIKALFVRRAEDMKLHTMATA